MEKRYWFKAKHFGWGWYPASWQGFIVLVAYVVSLGFTFAYVDKNSESAIDTLYTVAPFFILLTLLLLALCLITGERPRWRWGNRSKNKQENNLKKGQ